MRIPKRPPLLATSPLFVVADLQRSVDFYHTKLGFAEPGIWGEPPCFAMLNRDRFELMLSLAPTPDRVRPNGAHDVWDLYLRVPDVEAEMLALQGAGVAIVKGPTDTFYRMREIEVLDPDGYRICIAQDISE